MVAVGKVNEKLNASILRPGDYWGADMLLNNDTLRQVEIARTLSYVNLLSLNAQDLSHVYENFPEARGTIRWAQVQLAIVRGVSKIAHVSNELQQKKQVSIDALSDCERMAMFGR